MTGPGSGLCILAHGQTAEGEPIYRQADVGLLCHRHRDWMTRQAVEVRDLWMDLAFIVEAGSAPKDETPKTRHLKAAEAPAPANLEVLSLRDPRSTVTPTHANPGTIPSITALVASWVLLVADERPLTAQLPSGTHGQLSLLIRHGDWIAAQEWCGDYLEELGDMRKALAAALRDQAHASIGRCRLPADDRDGLCAGQLMRENGSDVVRCTACRSTWTTPQELARLAISLETA